ncbi:Rv3212 family protein [Rhodococcus koreensis]
MLAPERRSRADLIAAAGVAVAVVVALTVVWFRSDARGTTSVTAAEPPPALVTALTVPETLSPIWDSATSATTAPLVVGGAVVTAEGGDVVGRDRMSGAELWRYERDLDLCGVTASWEKVVAVYRDDRGCSQVTELDGGTGERLAQRNSDADPAVTLTADGTYVASRGDRRLELWRSDLVRTVEYGRVDAPVNPKKQPRSGCTLIDAGSSSSRLSVLERCPGEVADRLTVMNTSPKDNQEPEEYGSSVLAGVDAGVEGAGILGVSGETTAVYLPAGRTSGPRIGLFDGTGNAVSEYALALKIGPDPVTSASSSVVTWWTGSDVVALGASDLVPRWTFPGALGPGAVMAGHLLVPVESGIAVLDLSNGALLRTIPVARDTTTGPITTTVAGDVVLEQRGAGIVALR